MHKNTVIMHESFDYLNITDHNQELLAFEEVSHHMSLLSNIDVCVRMRP